MAKVTFGIDTIWEGTEYGLGLELTSGQGPTEFTIKPNPEFKFTLADVMNYLADLLNVPALSKVSQLSTKAPWENIFTTTFNWAFEPSLVVKVDKSASSIQLQIDLYENTAAPSPGVNLNPPSIDSKYIHVDIEPNITIYSLLVGYTSEKGFDVKAKVKFHNQSDNSDVQEIRTSSDENEDDGKTEVVKFPFPTPSAKNPIFKLKYIGLGQRFGPPLPSNTNDFGAALNDIFDQLEKNLTTNDPEVLLTQLVQEYYHPDRNWFFGLDINVKGWEVKLLFNDPVLYGLQVTASTGKFDGLVLIILYEKIGPHLGVYYGKLTIPEAYRTVNLGAVALTLPTIQIWIYTNGDFKVNVGWPLGPESIGIQVYIFTGGCGFYFGKLRSGDNPQNPNPPVVYNPILEFGLGVWIGLGRSIVKGPFSAELSLTLQGTFQGVLAWEEDHDITNSPDYFWFAATVSLVGTLQGKVDLKIIQLSVMVKLSVTAGIAFETGYNTIVAVSAAVKVSASVKVLFVKITVSFEATISETFTLSSGYSENASIDGPQNPSFEGMNGGGTTTKAVPELAYATRSLASPGTLSSVELPVTLGLNYVLYPAVVYDSGSENGPKAVAVLAYDIPSSPDDTWPWEQMLDAYQTWLLNTYSDGTNSWTEVANALAPGGSGLADFGAELVNDFLANQVVFELTGVDLSTGTENTEEQEMALFPILPNLSLNYNDGNDTVNFDQPTVSSEYVSTLEAYFNKFTINDLSSNSGAAPTISESEGAISLNGQLLIDFYLTIARQLAEQLGDGDTVAEAAPNLAGMVSRFLLNGLLILNPADESSFVGLYGLTGQQFPVDDTQDSVSADLVINELAPPPSGQPDFSKLVVNFTDEEKATATLPVETPPSTPPAFPASPLPLDALSSNPLWVSARNKLAWNTDTLVVPLPNRILNLLQSQALVLTVKNEFPDESSANVKGMSVSPGLIIPIKISQVSSDEAFNVDEEANTLSSFLPFLYQIGSTDDETRSRIESALDNADLSQAKITLLYNNTSGTNGYESDTQNPGNTLLVKTNLSTSSEPDSVNTLLLLAAPQNEDKLGPVTALQSDVADFLRIIWENSVVNSNGFFLYYQNAEDKDLPASIFTGNQADLNILLSFPQGSNFEAWHNVLTVNEAESNASLYIGVSDTNGNALPDYHPTFPAGCVAFEIQLAEDSNMLTAEGDNLPYSATTIMQLYHLIQYQVAQGSAGNSGTSFIASDWAPATTPSSQSSGGSDGSGSDTTNTSSSTTTQSFRQVIPTYKFLPDNGGDPIIPGGLPYTYGAVGGYPKVEFRLVDLYGNVLNPAVDLPATPVVYNDLLVSLAEWPGVQLAYRIYSTNDDKLLAMEITFNPKQVIRDLTGYQVEGLAVGQTAENGEDIQQQAQIALYKMYTVYNQINDTNTHFALNVTIFQTPANSSGTIAADAQLRTPLINFAKEIIDALNEVAVDPTKVSELKTLTTSVDVTIDPNQIAEIDQDILSLTVYLSMYRDADLATKDAANLLPKVVNNTFVVKPNLELTEQSSTSTATDGSDPNSPVTLTQFASDFEAVFLGFDGSDGQVKMATRTGNPDFSAAGNSAFLWTVKFSSDKGIAVSFGENNFNYFTLAPLSTKLIPNESVEVPVYDKNYNQTGTTTVTFTNIDVDAFAKTFLNSVDEILSPEPAAAIAKVDSADFDTIVSAKANLASYIMQNVIPVFEDGSGDLESAQDKFEQALLNQLSNAYTTDAIVQTDAQVTVSGVAESSSSQSPRLYGSIAAPLNTSNNGQQTSDQEYSLSNSKLELGASSGNTATEYLNFLATAKHPGEQADLELDLAYNAVFVEHLIDQAEEDYGYVPSSWLRFVITGENTPAYYSLGTANIPIPLREFPKNPNLQSQAASANQADELGNMPEESPVEDALKWEYTVNLIKENVVAQDELWFDLTYNLPVETVSNNALKSSNPDNLKQLFDQLAIFNTAYANLRPAFLENVSKVFDTPPTDPTDLKTITHNLAQLITNVATAWKNLATPGPLGAVGDLPNIITEHFVLSYKDISNQILTLYADVQNDFPATINGQGPISGLTAVADDERPESQFAYMQQYPFDPSSDGSLSIVWKGIDLIERQTALTTFWVVRNADLGSNKEAGQVNPDLVYQTNEVTFSNPILPLLSIGQIEAETFTSFSKTIHEAFKPFAEAGTASTQSRLLKIECKYAYNLASVFINGTPLSLPVNMATNLAYDLNLIPDGIASKDSSAVTLSDFSCCLAKDLTAWYNSNPGPAPIQAYLHFSVTLFALIDGSQLPLIQVKDLQVTVPPSSVGWWVTIFD